MNYNELLETEEYVHIPEQFKNTLGYKIAYAVKEEIRNHKWNQATEGNSMSWEEAMNDWMNNYYEDYVTWFKNTMWPEKQRTYIRRFPLYRESSQTGTAPLHYRI